MLRSILALLLPLSGTAAFAQTLTGSWYGRADVMAQGISNNYLTEFIVKQKGDEVEGVFAYYFKDSYQSFFIRGTYDKNTREVNIRNLPMLFYKSATRNGIECPMNFRGVIMVNQVQSSIKGSFYSDEKYKYTCPELRVNFSLDVTQQNQDSVLRNTVAGQQFWKPQEEDFVVTNAATDKPVTITADKLTIDSAQVTSNNAAIDVETALIERFEKRKNIYTQDIELESDSVRVSFYDNGDIDGDSISVFLNKKPVLVKQELTARSMNLYLTLDPKKPVNELGMFAENLGKYPPNTALMVITDGIKRYEVYLSSSLSQNATVRLKRKKK